MQLKPKCQHLMHRTRLASSSFTSVVPEQVTARKQRNNKQCRVKKSMQSSTKRTHKTGNIKLQRKARHECLLVKQNKPQRLWDLCGCSCWQTSSWCRIFSRYSELKIKNAVKSELTRYKQKTFICWNADRIFSCSRSELGKMNFNLFSSKSQ